MADDQQDQQQNDREDQQQDQHQNESHDTDSDDLGDKGKAALRAEREARKAAERERAELAKKIADFEKAQRDAEDAKAKERGEWEKIAAEREKEVEALRQQMKERETADRRRDAAKKAGLHDDLIPFIQGETDDDIEASVKALAKHLKPVDAPDTDAGRRGQGSKRREDNPSYQFGTRPI